MTESTAAFGNLFAGLSVPSCSAIPFNTDQPGAAFARTVQDRVDVAITVWEDTEVLRAPSTAPFRVSDKWCACVIRDGRAHLVNLETGASDANWAVIERGLNQGDKVLPQSSDTISGGTAVAVLREVRAPG